MDTPATDPVEEKKPEHEPRPAIGTYRKLYAVLEKHEQEFIRVAMRTGDYQEAAKSAGHKNPFELLSRTRVRDVIVAASPYCTPETTAALIKPYILQNLISEALSGNVPASKVLLELGAKAPKTRKVSYGSRTSGAVPPKPVAAPHQDEDPENE